jgi:hypothetical protein
VREIQIECALTRTGPALAGIASRSRPTVKLLVIRQDYMGGGDEFFDSRHCADHAVSDRVWGALPNLEILVLAPGFDIFDRIAHPTLHELVVQDGMAFCPYGKARAWNTPALRAVKWHYRTQAHEQRTHATPADFMPLWTAHAPNLVELDIAGAALHVGTGHTPLFEYERFLAMLEQLEVLRVPSRALGSNGQEVVATIRSHVRRLAHLREFAVTSEDRLDEVKMQKLVPGFVLIPTPWY